MLDRPLTAIEGPRRAVGWRFDSGDAAAGVTLVWIAACTKERPLV